MRYKFIILFLILGFVSKAQVYQLMPQYGYSTYRMNFDSTIQIPTFCGVPKLGSNKINKGALAFDSCNNRFYYFNPKTQVWDTIKSADASLFVKYTDTAQMLSAYLRAVDTTNKWVNSVTKLNDSTIQVIKGTTTSNITISSVSSATRLITQVWNNTGATILRGSVVYISGRHSSNLPTIALAQGNNEDNSYKTFALVDGDILDNSSGFVIQAGKITGLNLPTSSYTDGDILYLSPTVAGGYTITKPLAPNHICKLGSVTRAHPTQGALEIKIENGWQVDELSDVQIAAVPLDSTILQFSRVDSLWHDVNPTTAMGNRFIKPADTSAMLSPYLRSIDTTNKYVTSVFRKTASDSVFFVRGGSNNFAFRDSAGGGGWVLTGNSGTSDATNFLGTTDNQDLVFRRNNIESARIDSTSANAGITNFGFRTTGTATNNSAFGYKSLSINTSGTGFNSAFGANSGIATTSGNNNTSVGSNSFFTNSTGSQNTCIGGQSLYSNTLGSSNVGIGYQAGYYNTNLSNQIFINSLNRVNYSGDQTGSPFYAQQSTTVTNQIVALNGRIGINTISPSTSAGLEVSSTTQGFLQPRLTTTQMNAISTPATGLSVFNTTDSLEYVYRGTSSGWQKNVTYTRTNDIGLLNGTDQRLMIEPTTNIVAGRALTVEAGSTQAGGTSAFQGLSQTARSWWFIKAAPNGDVYATTETSGDIYKRTGGAGNFVALGQTTRAWYGIAAQSNGDVFIAVGNGFIYKQTGGTGNFTAVHSTSRAWRGMAAAPNNDLYAVVDNGDIYKSTDNGVTFTGLGQTSRSWRGITVAPNGDVYACVFGGDIWKSTNGGTTFTALNATGLIKQWLDITVALNGDIYATVIGGDIWRSTNGGATFTALGQTVRNWSGIGAAPNGDIYATAGVNTASDIFLQSAGTANLNGGTLVLQSGVGKGTGTSTINFNTGTTLASGATLQSASTKMTILGNGNVGIGTTSPSAILDVSSTTSAFLPPRMTTAQRDLITPVAGMVIYNTTTNKHQGYNGTTWNDFY